MDEYCVAGSYYVSYIKITRLVISKINKSLKKYIDVNYYKEIPVGLVQKALEDNGFTLVDDDGTKFNAFFCGEQGNAKLNYALITSFDQAMYKGVGAFKNVVGNSSVIISWFKMESGKYEINVYAS